MEKLRFAVVGCGNIGKRHIAVIDAEPEAELVALCDKDEERMKELGRNYSNVACYTSYQQLLAESNANIISICTPHGLHAEMSILAAQAGKQILVEKPMALNVADSTRMIEEAQKHGVNLYVVKQNRFNRPITLTQQALEEKRLGKVFMVQCNVLWNRHQRYYDESEWRGRKALEGGCLHTQVCHFLDLLTWWFGPLKEAHTILDTFNHEIEIEDCGVSALRFQSGILGSLTWTTCVYNVNYEGSITIIGEKGTIKIGGKYLNEIEFWDVQSYPLPQDVEYVDAPNIYAHYQGSSSNHNQLINQLVKQVIERRHGLVEGVEGRKTIEAIEMIYGGKHRH
ncbi:MAG: Gfo/Idh/MocA family oxidoreductase [Bacteroidia bacterium]